MGGMAPLARFGELVTERGISRLGRADEVGVATACEELVRRKVVEGSLGEAIVDMLDSDRMIFCRGGD